MESENKKCGECGEPLEPSQHLPKARWEGNKVIMPLPLVCRNYPNCSKAEKPIKEQD
jgi:hypothetical protein